MPNKTFSVIPVIDLLGGQAVHAVRGDRQAYQPLRSALCASSAPQAVAEALLNFYPFQKFYIADLDAIQHLGSHRAFITQLAERHAQVQWWVDDGSIQPWADKPANVMQVLGTESYPQLNTFTEDFVLSLDERNNQALGDPALHQASERWPQQLIAMTLSQVGTDGGPNFSRLKDYCAQYPQHQWFAAGGVRHVEDLKALKQSGVSGALIATALHKNRITAEQLAELEV